MSTPDSKLSQTLDSLGVSSADQVQALFGEVRQLFDSDISLEAQQILWKEYRDMWVGRKSGFLTQITDNWLKPSPADLKRVVGAEFQKLKSHVETKLEEKRLEIEASEQVAASGKDRIDLSLPGVIRPIGTHHLVRTVMQEIEDIFFSIGFSVVEGPEIETPYYNFEALNIPEHHPVRDDMDTFYLDLPKGAPGPLLLRTHTSPVQFRTMEKRQPPVRVIVPG